jgi:hypothetical protein
LKFEEYLATSNLTKYSEAKDGLGLACDHVYRDKDEKDQTTIEGMMSDPATTFRLRERNCTDGVWIGTKNKYAQIMDVSKASAKKAAAQKADRAESRSTDDYWSPENKAKRAHDDAVQKVRKDAYFSFIREKVIDLILPLVKISLLEMQVLFNSLDDKDIKEQFGEKLRFNENNRLEYYRRYYILSKHNWSHYEAAQKGVQVAIDENITPLLKKLKIELPAGYKDIVAEYVKQGETDPEVETPEDEDEEDVEMEDEDDEEGEEE